MFIKKKKENMFNFESKNYKMKDFYDTNDLFVANLEYVSSLVTEYGPMVRTTEQRYIFERVNVDDKVRYREVFTGFISVLDEGNYFDIPYVVNVEFLKDCLSSVSDSISKYGLLLLLDELNVKDDVKKLRYK